MRLFFVIVLQLFVIQALGQSFLIKNGERLLNSDTLFFVTQNADDYFTGSLDVINNTGQSLSDVQIKFNILNLVSETSYGYCWDVCYANPEDNHISVTRSMTKDDTLDLDFHYDPAGKYGISVFRLQVFSKSLQDSAWFFLVFDVRWPATFVKSEVERLPFIISGKNIVFDASVRNAVLFGAGGFAIRQTPGKVLNLDGLPAGIYFLRINERFYKIFIE